MTFASMPSHRFAARGNLIDVLNRLRDSEDKTRKLCAGDHRLDRYERTSSLKNL